MAKCGRCGREFDVKESVEWFDKIFKGKITYDNMFANKDFCKHCVREVADELHRTLNASFGE